MENIIPLVLAAVVSSLMMAGHGTVVLSAQVEVLLLMY